MQEIWNAKKKKEQGTQCILLLMCFQYLIEAQILALQRIKKMNTDMRTRFEITVKEIRNDSSSSVLW